MTERLTDEELAEIRTRVEMLADGEWLAQDYTREPTGSPGVSFPEWDVFVVPPGILEPIDAEFIAHARTDVPKLLGEIAALKDEIDTLHRELEDAEANSRYWESRYEDVKEDLEAAIGGDE